MPKAPLGLPAELAFLIASFCDDTRTLSAWALTCRACAKAVTRTRHLPVLATSSADIADAVKMKRLSTAKQLSTRHDSAQTTILLRPPSIDNKANTRARRSKDTFEESRSDALLAALVEPAVDSIVCQQQLPWTSFTRAQLARVEASSRLRAFAFTSAAKGRERTSFHSVAQLLCHLGALEELSLRDLTTPRKSVTLPRPPFKLKTLCLLGMDGLKSSDFCWLLRSTAVAESLDTLVLEWDASPRILNEVRYSALRATRFYLWTSTPGVAESFALHFPFLRHYVVRAQVPVNVVRLLRNIDSSDFATLQITVDDDSTTARSLIAALIAPESSFPTLPSRFICVRSNEANQAHLLHRMQLLQAVARAKGLHLTFPIQSRESQWLPARMRAPLNFAKWLDENGDKLKPPVNNYCLYDGGDFTVMVVGGPNSRNDYHVNETEEWFYQVKGKMLLKMVDNTSFDSHRHASPEGHQVYGVTGGESIEVEIGEGEMFLLPANTPHNPCRFADTIGLVVERVRPKGAIDRLRWYCRSGKHQEPFVIRERAFPCTNLGTQLKPIIDEWMTTEELRKCPGCGEVAEAK